MASKRSTTLTTIIDVEARVDKARKALSDFSKSLGNVNLSDSMTSNVQKTLGKLEQELTNFQGLSSKKIFSEKDAKQVQKSFEKIGDLLNTLSAQAKTIEGTDLSKLVPKEALNQLKDFSATLKDLKSQQNTLYAELSEKTKAASKAEKDYNNALKKRESVQNDIEASDKAEKQAKEKVATAQEKINKLTQEKQKIESKKIKAQSEIEVKQKELAVVNETIKKYKEYQALKQKANKTSGEKGAVTRYENANEKTIRQAQAGVFTKKKNALTNEIAQLETIQLSPEEQANLVEMEQAIAKEEEIVKKQSEIAEKARKSSSSASVKLAKLEGSDNLDGLKKTFENLKAQVDNFDTSLDSQKVEEFRKQLSEFADVSIDQIPTDLAEIQKYLEEMTRAKVDEVARDVENLGSSASHAKAPMEEMRESISKAVDEGKGFDDVGKEIDRLKQNVIDFFSIGNTIQLFKRAVQSAFDTVKELDETMTEAAVVTDFSVEDMWEQLPTYSAEAKKLGVSINELYGATTLYYQQGLKTKEAMEMGVETSKMARIANIEAANATEYMTSAVRGFNLEINELSAQRINDVYSELAAVSATDTEGIGVAMSKTASLAHSANMELETTAAFLTQIIETTQEAPEVAGTSLKTVISRFAEVKELREKGLTSGEDDEGEIVDVNKIQTALRTVGISMEGFFAGTEGLDSILLKLAEKWNTLDFETQRYIATQAAGSRQQSRFLALMSDYDRTMELVDSAYNSTGASQKQFEKTLDSLQTKLTNLKNAWDEFTMGLANSEIIKGAIDLLTKILDITNKIINTLSGGNATVKTFITTLTAIGGLKLGKKGLSSLFGDKIPDDGIFSKVFGKNDKKKIDKTAIGWGRESASNFKNSFTSEIKDIFSGNKMKGKLFGNILEADTTELSKTVKTSLENLNKEGNIGNLNLDQAGYDLHWDISNGDIDSAAQSLSRLVQEGKISSDQLKELGVDMNDIDAYAQVTSGQLDKTAQTLSQVGTCSAAAGAALLAIVPILEDMGASDDAIAVIKGIATALLVFPVVLKVVEVAVHAFAKGTTAAISSIPIIGWIAAAVSALIALGSVLASTVETSEKKLEKAKTALEESTAAAEEAKQAYDDLLNTKSNYSELTSTLSDLKEGTLEWRQALIDTNDEVLKLLEKYPELINHIERLDNGQLVITEEEWRQITLSAQNAIVYSQGKVVSDQAKVSYEKLQNSNSWETLTEEFKSGSDRQVTDTVFINNVLTALKENPNLFEKENKISRDDFNALHSGFQSDILEQNGANNAEELFKGKEFVYYYSEDFMNLFPQTDDGLLTFSPKQVVAQEDAFIEYSNKLNDELERVKLQIQNNLVSALSNYADGFDYLNQIIDRSLKDYNLGEEVETEEQIASSISKSWAGISQQMEEIVDYYSNKEEPINFIIDKYEKDQKDNLNEIYRKIDPVNYGLLTDEQKNDKGFLSSSIAARYSADKRTDTVSNQVDLISGLNESEQKNFIAALTGDYSSFSEEELNNSNFSLLDYAKKMYEDESLTKEEALKKLAQDFQYKDTAFKDLSYEQKYAIWENDKSSEKGSFEEYSSKAEVQDKIISADQLIGLDIVTNTNNGQAERREWLSNNVGKNDDEKTRQAQLEASQAGLDDEYRSKFVDYLSQESEKTGKEELTDVQASNAGKVRANLKPGEIEAIATANMKLNNGFSEIVESYDDWSQLIDETDGKIKASTAEEVEAYNTLKKSTNKMLNTSHELSDAFWDNAENVENIKKAAEGDVEALEALQKAAAQDYLLDLGIDTSVVEDFGNLINNIDLPPLEAGVELVGYEDFITSCNNLIRESGMTADQVGEYFKNLGYDVEFDDNPQEITSTEWLPVTSYKASGSLLAGTFSLEPTISYQEVKSPGTIAAPTIKTLTSNGSGGGGVSASNLSNASGNKPATKKSGGGGSSKKKEEKQVWKNPYDELYNTLEKIEELERQRNNLEDEYDRLLNKRSTTVKNLLANQEKSLKNLQEEKKLQLQVQKAELAQVKNAKNYEYLATKKGSDGDKEQYWTTFQKEATKLGLGSLDNYAKYDATTGVVQIDQSRIEKIEDNTKTGEDQGALIEAYIDYLKENSDAYEEATDRLAEIQDEIDEINSRGIEEYLDMQTRIYDALVSQRQQEIDSMETIFEGINDSNSKILDGLQEQVDLQRQTRDNTKKEEDIADMEARLAYLRRDTSGANALEIKQLEEQLADTREEYSDSLVDQYIQNLQDQESKAQEQRQEQIEIANAQLQWMEETGAFWSEVDNLWENAFNKNGKVDENSELFDLLKDTEKFKGMSEEQQNNFIKTLVTELNEAGVGDKNLEKQQKDEELSAIKKNEKLQGAVDINGKSVGTLTKQSDGTWKTSAGNTYSSVEWNQDKGAYVATGYTKAPTSNNGGNDGKGQNQEQQFPYGKASETTGNIKKGSEGKAVKAIQYALNKLGYGNSGTESVDGKFGSNTKKAVQKFQKAMGLKQDGIIGTNTRSKFKAKGYATGGLADYTGPAWLDGTKSKPELVLNSKDTENFIVLKDVLSDVLNGLSGKNSTSSSGGDNYFDINIVVDEIANDYDVDQLAEKIKKQIYDDSTYRNVNAISWIR